MTHDGPGFDSVSSDEEIARLLAGVDADSHDDGATVEHRAVDFDVAAVVDALASVLTRGTFVENH